jgi:hypothetical protein
VALDAQLVKGRDTPVRAYKILAVVRDEAAKQNQDVLVVTNEGDHS